MVSFFSQQRSVFFLALVALTVLVAVPPGGLHVAAQTDDSIVESTMEPTMGATDPIVAPPEDDDEPRDSALDCSPELLGDGQCDDEFNTEACGELSFCLFFLVVCRALLSYYAVCLGFLWCSVCCCCRRCWPRSPPGCFFVRILRWPWRSDDTTRFVLKRVG